MSGTNATGKYPITTYLDFDFESLKTELAREHHLLCWDNDENILSKHLTNYLSRNAILKICVNLSSI